MKHTNPGKPYEKGIVVADWLAAYSRLEHAGELTAAWFFLHMPACAREGSCNFTTIGGIFQLLGIVEYRKRGVYRRVQAKATGAE